VKFTDHSRSVGCQYGPYLMLALWCIQFGNGYRLLENWWTPGWGTVMQ